MVQARNHPAGGEARAAQCLCFAERLVFVKDGRGVIY